MADHDSSVATPGRAAAPGELEWFKGRAQYLENLYDDRNDMYEEIDNAIHGEWELPPSMAKVDWAQRAPEPAFAITVNAATRIISDVEPRITITPSEANMMRVADEQEKGLGWLQSNASRRRNTHIIGDVGASAVRYGEVTALVTYLPTQVKGIKNAGGDTKRWESMMRRSPFLVEVFHPKSVFPRYSSVGLEEVAMKRTDDPAAIVDMWGEHADELKNEMAASILAGNTAPQEVTYHVYQSYDWHSVWVDYGEGDGGKTIEIYNKKWSFPFLPWACRIGGTNLEDTPEDQRNPLLKVMYDFDLFDLMSSVRSMRISDIIHTAGSPKRTFKSGSAESPEIIQEAGEHYERIDADDDIEDRTPPQPDPAMALLYNELGSDHQKATLSDLLLGGEIPSNAAFATINLVTHSALAAIKPVREVIEGVMADISEIMLLWIHYGGEPVAGYGRNEDGEHETYYMHPEDIDPQNIYIKVNVDADLPTDRQTRAIVGRMLVESGFYSRKEAMEDVGVKDATAMEEDIYMDRMMEAKLQIDIKNEAFEHDLELREQFKQAIVPELLQDPEFLQMAMQAIQQMAAQEQAQGGAGAGIPPTEQPGPGALTGQVEGQGAAHGGPDLGIPPESAPEQPGDAGPVPAEFAPQAIQELRPGGNEPAFS